MESACTFKNDLRLSLNSFTICLDWNNFAVSQDKFLYSYYLLLVNVLELEGRN